MAIGYQEKGWEWTIEAFYHHLFTNDAAILGLAKELNYPIIIKRPITSSLIDGEIYQLDSPGTLLSFKKLRLMREYKWASSCFFKFNPYWKPLERQTATAFLSKTIGKRAYSLLWEPLLLGKFGKYADTISLAWFWARIAKRTTNLAYPEGGFLNLQTSVWQKKLKKKEGKFFTMSLFRRFLKIREKSRLATMGYLIKS